jgi:hypothetical protein
MNYDGRVFRSVENSAGGDVGGQTTFHYHQRQEMVWATYQGGAVTLGTLLATVDANGVLDMRYQHRAAGVWKSGRCQSRPELLPDGRLRLHERWQWTDGGEGTSIVEEVAPAAAPKVWVFFYGSYMNFDVLREVQLSPDRWEVARLSGFDVRIAPRANLIRSPSASVYGLLATATHDELTRLYAHARDVLGETYLPEAVLAEALDGGHLRPALCYIAPAMASAPAAPDYVDRILRPARELGFPDWYLDRLASFSLSSSAGSRS